MSREPMPQRPNDHWVVQARLRIAAAVEHQGSLLDWYITYETNHLDSDRRAIAQRLLENDQAVLRQESRYQEERRKRRTHWTKLPPVSHGYTRIPDRGDDRMVRCDTCGSEVTSLGIGYHRQNTGH